MEVLTYQLVIIATICVAYWKSARLGLLCACFWTAETLILLFFPPLIVIQLLVVWGTYAVLRSFASKDRLILLLREQDPTTREQIRSLESHEIEFIEGPKHATLLRTAIAAARESICVLSGWLSDRVIDGAMIDSLEDALRRGVAVYIGYGYRSWESDELRPEAKRALAALEALRNRSSAHRGSLHIARFPTHEKLLVQDMDFLACGSHNWLSTSWFGNRQSSVLVRRKDLARFQRDRIRKLVLEEEHPDARVN